MSGFVHSHNIFNYFENVICPVRANNLHPYSTPVALRFTSAIFKEHFQNYACYYFKCRIPHLLAETLISKGYTNIAYISVNYNAIKLV